jgi:nodulation protein E
MQRIAITGMGAISAAGQGANALWDAARTGRSGVRPIELEHALGNRILVGADVPDFDASQFVDETTLRTCDRYTQFALCAASEAIEQSGLEPADLRNDRTAVIVGTGIGGIGTLDENCRAYYAGRRGDTFAVPRTMPSSAASHITIVHGITGPGFAVSSACASASQAVGLAMTMIRAGVVDRVVTGGAEACLTPATMRGWEYLRVLTPDVCRPFSVGRNGMVIGEGAAVFILEAETVAHARGARPLAWLSGYGTSSDARDMVQPDVEGAARAVSAALKDAGIAGGEIGYINAHGTGTVLNDINEASALRQAFGDTLDNIPVSSSKPIVGHALGAAGALELVITVGALRGQWVPPQINCHTPDPKCPLNLQLDVSRSHSFEFALSNSFAFGGINAVLVVSAAR